MSEPRTSIAPQSDRHLAASIGKNTIFGIIASVSQVGTRLITIPIVIYHLGLGGYGIWSIIMATAAYMRFGSAGIKSAFQKYVAEATGTGDFETASVLITTGSVTVLLISLAGLIPISFFSPAVARISGVPPEFLRSTAASISVLAVAYTISNFGAAYEAIVMGGHRIDITRKFSTVLTACEAVAIIILLHFGDGLLAMTVVMASSELVYIGLCYVASHRVVPQMRVSLDYFQRKAYPELIRFAGSYQLVNVLEILYMTVIPIAILRIFGAAAAGIFAVSARLVSAALIAQDASVLPLLSGGTMVLASQASDRIGRFLAKSFKLTLAASVLPLAVVCSLGTTIIFAWTGQTDPRFRMVIWLCAFAYLFRSLSLMQLVLYRASGRAMLDNVRQVLRIGAILVVAALAKRIGFSGVLVGMALTEFAGVIVMYFGLSRALRGLNLRALTTDALRILAAASIIVAGGYLGSLVLTPFEITGRSAAAITLLIAGGACLLTAWPAIALTRVFSSHERRMLLDTVFSSRDKILALN